MKKIGIAFGSGGARGIAHILMIEALEELKLKPALITGSSIGAVVGAFYAAGFNSKEMRTVLNDLINPKSDSVFDFLLRSDLIKLLTMFDPQFIKSGFIKGDKFLKFLESKLGVKKFEDLEIPFKVIATDYWNKKEVIFDKGDLLPAIRASYSLPGLFTPITIKKHILIDGGVVNPLPYDLLKPTCDISIAIDVTSVSSSNGTELPSTFDAIFTSYQTMQNSIIQERLKYLQPDVYIKPEIYDVRVFDFAKKESIMKQASSAKKELCKKLSKLLVE